MKKSKSILQKILFWSFIIELLLAINTIILVLINPSESCRVYGDCVGNALVLGGITVPFIVISLVNFGLSFLKPRLIWLKILMIIWLILTWLYVLYFICLILLLNYEIILKGLI